MCGREATVVRCCRASRDVRGMFDGTDDRGTFSSSMWASAETRDMKEENDGGEKSKESVLYCSS